MTTLTVAARPEPFGSLRGLVGRCHLHPLLDYSLVGGGIAIPVFAALYFFPGLIPTNEQLRWQVFLFVNAAHFAASTVRLYTKPGAKEAFPFLSWWFPVICLLAAGVGLYWPLVGNHLEALYFTWSPYHYAAQTYGLAVMYAMRSGARLEQRDKMQIWWVCLLPFLYAFFTAQESGFGWFVDREWLSSVPALSIVHQGTVGVLTLAIFALPCSLFWQLHRMRGKNVPLISLLLQLTNGIWWLATDYPSAWWWAAMFHSIQYLMIVMALHASEQMARTKASNANPLDHPIFHAGVFYGMSVLLSAFLFFGVPLAYVWLGFDATKSFWIIVVVINLHHFIVDGFIWRTKSAKGPPSDTRQDNARVAAMS